MPASLRPAGDTLDRTHAAAGTCQGPRRAFHFPAAADNSGFVGWLASELKDQLGTGVAVLCGYNSAQGGIYDYWSPHDFWERPRHTCGICRQRTASRQDRRSS
ncbi:DUF6196 family protein [Streptomyces sp. CA-250714]|uniref:DUF6196 family protein n=1 Tax=Streptomyces sp. CA-250714 TaxID=3240060 RepID=UPI003D9225AA